MNITAINTVKTSSTIMIIALVMVLLFILQPNLILQDRQVFNKKRYYAENFLVITAYLAEE